MIPPPSTLDISGHSCAPPFSRIFPWAGEIWCRSPTPLTNALFIVACVPEAHIVVGDLEVVKQIFELHTTFAIYETVHVILRYRFICVTLK